MEKKKETTDVPKPDKERGYTVPPRVPAPKPAPNPTADPPAEPKNS